MLLFFVFLFNSLFLNKTNIALSRSKWSILSVYIDFASTISIFIPIFRCRLLA
ncbi:hypothetical protein HMPREF0476_0315 [Kingella kingae ATCC 23330]|uniref:Uncharacterized protein n=1 Tax=Kingella kingae ATCC 23330 TaxID=887327 RepID=F5S532_KINKI|nr:hypothetical protein HMPREF0476_0315 [Kingella kingae ATCC 23330]